MTVVNDLKKMMNSKKDPRLPPEQVVTFFNDFFALLDDGFTMLKNRFTVKIRYICTIVFEKYCVRS
jgi:hypothetical protein